jgi:hypothetical protein
MGWKVWGLIPGMIRIFVLSKNSRLAEGPIKALVPRTEEISSPGIRGPANIPLTSHLCQGLSFRMSGIKYMFSPT